MQASRPRAVRGGLAKASRRHTGTTYVMRDCFVVCTLPRTHNALRRARAQQESMFTGAHIGWQVCLPASAFHH
jgi:hypothetical protein